VLERISNLGTFQRRLKRPASRDKQTPSGAAMAVRLVIVKAPPYNTVHVYFRRPILLRNFIMR